MTTISWILLVVAIILLCGGGFFLYKGIKEQKQKKTNIKLNIPKPETSEKEETNISTENNKDDLENVTESKDNLVNSEEKVKENLKESEN